MRSNLTERIKQIHQHKVSKESLTIDIVKVIDERLGELNSCLESSLSHRTPSNRPITSTTTCISTDKSEEISTIPTEEKHIARSKPCIQTIHDDVNAISVLLTPSSQLKPCIHSMLKCTTLSPESSNSNDFDLDTHNIGDLLLSKYLKETLPSESSSFANITVLSLRENNLVTKDLQSFSFLSSTCPFIQSIDLSGNHISGNFPVTWASSLLKRNILSLDLSFNELNDIKNLVVFENLEYLNVSHNRISCLVAFPTKFLKSLDLSFNLISTMINFRIIGMCKELRSLSIVGNPLNPLSDSMEAKKQLKSLRIAAHSLFPKLEQLNDKMLSRFVLQQIEGAKLSTKTTTTFQAYRSTNANRKSRAQGVMRKGEHILPKSSGSQSAYLYYPLETNFSQKNIISSSPEKNYNQLEKRGTDSTNSARMRPNQLTRRMRELLPKRAIEEEHKLEEIDPMVIEDYNSILKQKIQAGTNSFVIACNLAAYDVLPSIDGKIEDEKKVWTEKFATSLNLASLYPSQDLPDPIRCALSSKDSDQFQDLKKHFQDVSALSIVLHGLKVIILGHASTTATKISPIRLKSYVEMLMQTQAGQTVHASILKPNHVDFEKIMRMKMSKMQIFIEQLANSACIDERESSATPRSSEDESAMTVSPRNDILVDEISLEISCSDDNESSRDWHVFKRKDDGGCDSPPKRRKSMENVLSSIKELEIVHQRNPL
jgi:hypothetical protein